MRIHIICVGKKMPQWISEGYHDYAKRFPKEFAVSLTELPPESRSKDSHKNLDTLKDKEGDRILKAIPTQAYTVALDVKGKMLSTEQFADKLHHWQGQQSVICFLIGGA